MQSNTELNAQSYLIFANSLNELFIKKNNISDKTIIIHKNQSTIYDFLKDLIWLNLISSNY